MRDTEIVDSYRSMVDIPAMLDSYAKADTIELMGMGFDHPLFPSFTLRAERLLDKAETIRSNRQA